MASCFQHINECLYVVKSQLRSHWANEAAAASEKVIDKRIMAAKGRAEARVKALEEQNASLKAEVASLRERLRRFEHLDDHLSRTGRLLPA